MLSLNVLSSSSLQKNTTIFTIITSHINITQDGKQVKLPTPRYGSDEIISKYHVKEKPMNNVSCPIYGDKETPKI